jgi:pimeloyl-ACP methyl ester carboxylesterase
MQSLGDWDWRSDFGQVSAPVLIMQGDRDPIPMASAHEWRDAFRDARLLVLEEAGHYSYADRSDVFVRAVGDFLK